jgi:eukaryotic-like serine/threonine-protein kinase
MPLTPGACLGTYEIVAPLGAGGMGEVYRARDTRLGRDVALKVLPANVATHPDRVARFEREARTVAGLNHPNIVVLYSVEDDGDVRFLTMELVDGQSLDHALTPGGLPVARVIELGIALADALVAAHEKGVVHRDLKPANVMLTRDGRVKVLDFGLARLAPPALDSDLTQAKTVGASVSLSEPGMVLGTVPYMAPERLRGEAVDTRSDLFSLGVVLYELASGRRPFTGGTLADISSMILRDVPESLSRVRPGLPAEFARIVSRCLEKSPRARPQAALDVANDLRGLRQQLEHGASGAPAIQAPGRVASIAVLPFVNRSRDEDDEYFSDGLADELLNVLSKIRGLRVVARASAFQFKGKNEDLAVIGARLNVATVLDGSVRKAGTRVRISVQLVKVADSSHLWSGTYDRTMDDIFAVQDDIAQSVVKELRLAFLGEEADAEASGRARAEVARAAKGRGADPEAHRLHLLARHLLDRDSREDVAKGIEYLKQALALDPEFALAWAELGRAHILEADRGWSPVAEGYGQARGAIERSLALEPDLAEGHIRMGWIRMTHDWDWPGAEESFSRALEMAPGNATVLREAGILAWKLGRLNEATGLFRRALEQDPLSAAAYHSLGFAEYVANRFAEAETAYREALELAPQRVGTHAFLSLALLAQHRGMEALAEAVREPVEAFHLWALAIVHHGLGHGKEADEAMHGLIEGYAGDSAYQIAEALQSRGEADAAFEWLERAYAQRDAGLAEMKLDPHFRSLHGDPRWGTFLEKMGFED